MRPNPNPNPNCLDLLQPVSPIESCISSEAVATMSVVMHSGSCSNKRPKVRVDSRVRFNSRVRVTSRESEWRDPRIDLIRRIHGPS